MRGTTEENVGMFATRLDFGPESGSVSESESVTVWVCCRVLGELVDSASLLEQLTWHGTQRILMNAPHLYLSGAAVTGVRVLLYEILIFGV